MNQELYTAVKIGDLEKVKHLVVLHGASEQHSFVQKASRYGHLEIVKYLVSLGADISKITQERLYKKSSNVI